MAQTLQSVPNTSKSIRRVRTPAAVHLDIPARRPAAPAVLPAAAAAHSPAPAAAAVTAAAAPAAPATTGPVAEKLATRAAASAPAVAPAPAASQPTGPALYDSAAIAERVKTFAPLVRRMAFHLTTRLPPSVSVDDIVQAGMIGLMDAAARYQEGQGAQFETFASQRIRGAMLDELRVNDWLPRKTRKALRQVESAVSRLEQRLGRAPAEREIAQELAMPLDEYQSVLQEARGYELVHLEDFGHEDDDDYLERHCPDGGADPLQRLQDLRFREALVRAIDALPEREKLLMGLYYEQELNFKEIAGILGVSESRVCQLHSQAVARLRAKVA